MIVSPQVQDLQHQQLVDQPQRRVHSSTYFVLPDLQTALKGIMETEGMELEIIINPKVTDDGQAVVQVQPLRAEYKHLLNFS
jgi:hypothetical protein